eukprot:4022183-Pyramimonas_sp.AAC.1
MEIDRTSKRMAAYRYVYGGKLPSAVMAATIRGRLYEQMKRVPEMKTASAWCDNAEEVGDGVRTCDWQMGQ